MKCLLLFLLLPSCSFIENANEFKGHGRLDILFPFSLIPGLDSVLPHFVIDIMCGFQWQNAEQQHQHEMEKLRLEHEIKQKEAEHEIDFSKEFLDALSAPTAGVVLDDRKHSETSGEGLVVRER